MSDETTEDLYGNFHFLLEVETVRHGEREIIAGFATIAGGGVKIEKRDTTHGDTRFRTHEPGQVEFENLKLTRGMTRNQDLLKWVTRVVDGEKDLRSGSVIMLDNRGEEVRRFNFYDAYPCQWSGPDLNAEGSAVAVESFELAVGSTRWE